MISLQKESGESTQKVNFRIKETKKISVFLKSDKIDFIKWVLDEIFSKVRL